ncbi:hypothetical protein HK096_002341 [Nowakowskiella sp. JEL0078]|nr:hypothetical protein HK096_002341 [Nowakowskiella sp. JEL0078]
MSIKEKKMETTNETTTTSSNEEQPQTPIANPYFLNETKTNGNDQTTSTSSTFNDSNTNVEEMSLSTPVHQTSIKEKILSEISSPPPTFFDGSLYLWTQTDDQITISFPFPSNPSFQPKKDFLFECTDNSILCSIKGETEPRVKGKLFASINKFDSLWQVDKNSQLSQPLITIHLEKAHTQILWPHLIHIAINEDLDHGIDPQSLYILGLSHHSDLGMPRKSLELITKAAQRGCIPAQLKLAAWFELGRGEVASIPVDRDMEQALLWHKRAADLENAEACYIVGTCYVQGTHGVAKSYVDALAWFRKCIESKTFQNLAKSVDLGVGSLTKEQMEQQESIFLSAAFQAGLLLMEGGHGLGDPQPKASADVWTKSAGLGHAQSAWNLGIFYLNGFGVERNIKEAIRLIRAATVKGGVMQLPPQLEGLSERAMDILVQIAEEIKIRGEPLPSTETLVERARNRDALLEIKSANGKVHDNDTDSLADSIESGDTETSLRFKISSNSEKYERGTVNNSTSKRKVRRKKLKSKTKKSAWEVTPVTSVATIAIIGVGVYVWYKHYRQSSTWAGVKTFWCDVLRKSGISEK